MSNHKKKDTAHVSEEINPHIMEVDDLDPFSQAVLGLVDRKSRFDLKKMEVIKGFWLMYDFMYQPMKRTASIFAAALDYVFSTDPAFGGNVEVTKVGMAKRYGGDRKAISRKITEFKNALTESFTSDHELEGEDGVPDHPPTVVILSEERFEYEKREVMAGRVVESDAIHELDEIDEITRFEWEEDLKNSPFISGLPKTNEQRAQALVYLSLDSLAHDEILLCKEALEWDSCNSDAYTLLGTYQRDQKHAEAYYQKAIACAEERLGDAFIQDHYGHFWEHLDARPYLRSKAALADLRDTQRQNEEAIDRYEELLQLNQSDEQGVRDHLIRVYLEQGQYQDAHRVRETYLYDEDIRMLYNDILISIGLNHSNEIIQDKIEKAKKVNPYVVSFLIKGESDVQDEGFEDMFLQDDALEYLFENSHLWEGREHFLIGT